MFRPRTVLCERHELIRFGLKRVVSEVVEIVGEASDGMAAMELIRRLKPDFVITDVDLDILNGVSRSADVFTMRCQLQMCLFLRIRITPPNITINWFVPLLEASVLKSSGPRTLFEAIRTGDSWIARFAIPKSLNW